MVRKQWLAGPMDLVHHPALTPIIVELNSIDSFSTVQAASLHGLQVVYIVVASNLVESLLDYCLGLCILAQLAQCIGDIEGFAHERR